MSVAKGFVQGIVHVITFTSPPLYRYPYRTAYEAFRSDWKRIGRDIETARHGVSNLNTPDEGDINE